MCIVRPCNPRGIPRGAVWRANISAPPIVKGLRYEVEANDLPNELLVLVSCTVTNKWISLPHDEFGPIFCNYYLKPNKIRPTLRDTEFCINIG
jgi:hypothetical protein